MTLKDLFRDTLQTLWSHKLRTCLTMFGIAWGIISITLMVAAGEGLRVAFIGSEAKKQLFATRPAIGEALYVAGFPFTIIGVMQAKMQDSSYDGFDINKVYVPFSVMLEDFPNKPPSLPDSLDHLLVTPLSVADHEACKWQVRAALARIHGFDPQDKDATPDWDMVEEAQSF